MTKRFLPLEVEKSLNSLYKDGFLFGVVASSQGTAPNIRMMRIYAVNEEGCPILLTHMHSQKWKEFSKHPHVAVCMVSEDRLLQVLVRGSVELSTIQSAPDQAKHYWSLVRADVKKIYDPAHLVGEPYAPFPALKSPIEVPESFGILCIRPTFWEILSVNTEYTESHRIRFELKEGMWQKHRIFVG
jgi:pyridoxine/pyridoxamine 5'-phosphate oxidase